MLKRKITIKAHTVVYKGFIFRSKLEVQWAFLFDCLGLPWDYEPNLYKIAPSNIFPAGCFYVPDFKLQSGIFECKPTLPSGEEIAKGLGVLGASTLPFFFLIGYPMQKQAIHKITMSKFGRPKFGQYPKCNEVFEVTRPQYDKALLLNSKMVFKALRNI